MATFEEIEAVVKMDVLVHGVGSLIPEYPDARTVRWLNAWLGPHWVLMPQPGGIPIWRGDALVFSIAIWKGDAMFFSGRLIDFTASRVALEHKVGMKMLDVEVANTLFEMSSHLTQTIEDRITPVLSSDEIQRRVQSFFDFYRRRLGYR